MSTDSKGRASGPPGFLRSVASVLTSLKFALSLVALIALVSVLGTILPQGSDVAQYLRVNPAAKARLALFEFLGLTHLYTSSWFIALLGLFAASLAACTLRRCAAVRRLSGRACGRAIGSVVTHVSMLLILAGAVVRGLHGHRGNIQFHEGETRSEFVVDDRTVPLPFTVHLAKFEIETYDRAVTGDGAEGQILSERLQVVWPAANVRTTLPVQLNEEQWVTPDGAAKGSLDALRVKVLRRVLDFSVDTATRQVASRSDAPRNPAVQIETLQAGVTNTQWVFAKFPDFDMHSGSGPAGQPPPFKLLYQMQLKTASEAPRIKDYKSTLQIREGDRVVKEKTIEVNVPLSYKGYTFYQSGYNPRDPKWTSLLVVRDPGVPLVYAGFALMIAGLAIVFYVYPGPGGQAAPKRAKGERDS